MFESHLETETAVGASNRDVQPLNDRKIFKVDIPGHHKNEMLAESSHDLSPTQLKKDLRATIRTLGTTSVKEER